MKINRKQIFEIALKNRYIIILSIMLILGTVFGTSMLNILPEIICKNIFAFLSKETSDFYNNFFNIFSLSFFFLTASYLSGFSLIGSFFVPAIVFSNGIFYGFKNAVFYKFSGNEYILSSVLNLIITELFFVFLLIILSESAIFLSKSYSEKSKNQQNNPPEKSHYNARNHSVKFIAFTAISVIVSVFSAYFIPIIKCLL